MAEGCHFEAQYMTFENGTENPFKRTTLNVKYKRKSAAFFSKALSTAFLVSF